MLDVAVSYNRYKFIGHEFLTWLWYVVDNKESDLQQFDDDQFYLEIGNRIVLENSRTEDIETITIKGNEAGMEEGLLSLKKGAIVTELNLIYRFGDHDWQFNIKGESLHMSGVKLPETGNIETKEDIEGAVLEKIYLYDQLNQIMDKIFKFFIKLRVSENWEKEHVPAMKKWII